MARTKVQAAKAKAEGKDNSSAKSRLEELGMPASVTVQINGQSMLATAKDFSTGSVGYYGFGKVLVGDNNHPCQVSLNIVATHTKPGK